MKQPTETQKLAKEEQARLNRLWFDKIGGNDAVDLVKDLERQFGLPKLISKDREGRVDPYQTLANNGSYAVLIHIMRRIDLGSRNE